METSKTNGKMNEREEEAEEEVYEDEYEVETESKAQHETSKLSKITDDTIKHEKSSLDLSSHTEDTSSRDEDYVEDPSTSQYDAYYYYDDYGNSSKSRYEAIGKIQFENCLNSVTFKRFYELE